MPANISHRALRGTSLASHEQFRAAIDRFVQAYNADAAPTACTNHAVHPKGLASSSLEPINRSIRSDQERAPDRKADQQFCVCLARSS